MQSRKGAKVEWGGIIKLYMLTLAAFFRSKYTIHISWKILKTHAKLKYWDKFNLLAKILE